MEVGICNLARVLLSQQLNSPMTQKQYGRKEYIPIQVKMSDVLYTISPEDQKRDTDFVRVFIPFYILLFTTDKYIYVYIYIYIYI